jgi:pyruvate dehydrogenase E2 component (dihydrolipoamide acetyltransferase)
MATSPRGLPVKETLRLNRLRKVMAQTMKASVDSAALSQVNREIDVTALQELRRSTPADSALRLSLNTLIMAAVARTLPSHPLLNAELVENSIVVYDTVNLGMAVAVPDGLIVVVIPAAHKMALVDLQEAIARRAERARTGKLAMEDVEGGTFTVTNLGMFGIDGGFPLPRPPEGAILLVGAARPKPAVVDGQIAIRDIALFSLSFDHRFIDGAAAAAFLRDINDLMAAPALLWTADH